MVQSHSNASQSPCWAHSQQDISLAVAYYCGLGVPEDLVLAYMGSIWACEVGSTEAEGWQCHLAEQMTAFEIALGERLAADWKAAMWREK